MRKALLLFFVIASVCNLYSQDFIITKKSEKIEAKVIEIGESTVKYKKWSYLEGPNYTISKSDISSILYQNGEVEVFGNEKTQQAQVQSNNVAENEYVNEGRYVNKPSEKSHKSRRDSCFKKEKFNFYFTLGVAFPIGKYGKTDDKYYSAIYSYYTSINDSPDAFEPTFGAASKAGALFGMNFHIPVFRKNHHVIALLIRNDLHFSTISQKEKKEFIKYELQWWKDIGDECNAEYGVNGYMYQMGKFSSYWDVSLKIGLDYTWYLNKKVGFFINGDVGIQMNLVSRTNILNTLGGTIMGTEYNETYGQWVKLYSPNGVNYKYSPGFSFAYEGSAGILLGDVISIAFLYSGGTAHKYNMKLEEYSNKQLDIPSTPLNFVSGRLRTQYVALLLGFHL